MVRPLLRMVGCNVYPCAGTRRMNQSGDERSLKATLARAWTWLVAFVRQLDASRTTGMAAELAFWLFLALIPLAAVAGLVLARFALGSERVPELLASLPPETRNLIQEQLATVAAWNGGRVAAPAAVVFLWLASGGIHAMFDVLEVKAGVARPWWRVLPLVRGALPWDVPSKGSLSHTVARIAVGFGTAVVLVTALYLVGVPRSARKSRVVLPGAVLAVALQTLLGYGYAFYLGKVGVHSAYQAGLSIIGVTMIALYLFALALLIGAELNYVIGKDRALGG